jgi:hypothetical protein
MSARPGGNRPARTRSNRLLGYRVRHGRTAAASRRDDPDRPVPPRPPRSGNAALAGHAPRSVVGPPGAPPGAQVPRGGAADRLGRGHGPGPSDRRRVPDPPVAAKPSPDGVACSDPVPPEEPGDFPSGVRPSRHRSTLAAARTGFRAGRWSDQPDRPPATLVGGARGGTEGRPASEVRPPDEAGPAPALDLPAASRAATRPGGNRLGRARSAAAQRDGNRTVAQTGAPRIADRVAGRATRPLHPGWSPGRHAGPGRQPGGGTCWAPPFRRAATSPGCGTPTRARGRPVGPPSSPAVPAPDQARPAGWEPAVHPGPAWGPRRSHRGRGRRAPPWPCADRRSSRVPRR